MDNICKQCQAPVVSGGYPDERPCICGIVTERDWLVMFSDYGDSIIVAVKADGESEAVETARKEAARHLFDITHWPAQAGQPKHKRWACTVWRTAMEYDNNLYLVRAH